MTRCTISCTTIYSRHCGGFLARSVLRRMLLDAELQLPHLVFIFCTKKFSTFTPITGSHFAINGGTASLICLRYHPSTTACFLLPGVPERNRRNIRLCFNSIDRGSSHSITLRR